MANEKDIFEKMDALVRKHHPAPAQAAATNAPAANTAPANIPTLTDVIPNPGLEAELEKDLIPLLTEAIPPPQADPDESTLELDLDPYFTITGREPSPPSPAPEVTTELSFQPEPEASDLSTLPKLDGPLFTDIVELNATVNAPLVESHQESIPFQQVMSAEALAQFADTLSEQMMRALDQRLQQAVDKKIAPQLAQTVDKALSSMLDQFSVNIEDMVRESIAQELQRQLTALLNGSGNGKSTPTSSNSSAQTDDSV